MDSLELKVDLAERSYPIRIGPDLLSDAELLASCCPGPDVLLVTNETVAPLYAGEVTASLASKRVEVLVVPDGEAHKTLDSFGQILDKLVAMRANRDVTVAALGGGVIGDMTGFAAATYQRGVRFLQIPTTLLAQVDSSVGGKTAVNHPAGKNLIGAFHQPGAVVIDTQTLATLPPRELNAGLAEVIKYAVLGDLEFFNWLEQNISGLLALEPEPVRYAIQKCCAMKAAIVQADEREQGQRALLNLGHTFGHAIEAGLGYGEWLHGEAVGAGMLMAAVASELSAADIARLRALLEAAGLPVKPPPLGADRLHELMALDKKVLDGRIRLILLRGIGDAFVTADYDTSALAGALAMADDV